MSERQLRVVAGSPTAEELAVVTALLATAAANAGESQPNTGRRRGGWGDPAVLHRRPLLTGPNGWRAAAWR